MPCVGRDAIEDYHLCLGRADGQPQAMAEAMLLKARACESTKIVCLESRKLIAMRIGHVLKVLNEFIAPAHTPCP